MLIDGRSLTCCDVATQSGQPIRATLSGPAWTAIEASHQAALAALEHRPVYGRSTGVGANKDVAIGSQLGLTEYAVGLLRSHATSAGEFRTAQRVRAMLLIRLNQLASGGSGISPGAVSALVKMINADALPSIREFAGIGTGDLSALATTALGLLGEAPLTRALPPVSFGVHDALPFLSSNAATLGDVAIAGHRLQDLARSALTVATLTTVAVRGNLEAFAPAAARATPGPGSDEVCRTVRGLLAPAPPSSSRVQDPFAVRCLPQVNGSMLDALAHLENTGDDLLNIASENPMILPGTTPGAPELVVHHGGFHLPGLALACDSAAIAVAQSGPLLLSRLAMLIDPRFTGAPPFLGDGRPGASGVMLLEFVAGSALAVLRSAAVPASLGTVSISRGAEEDASFASRAAAQLFDVASAFAIAQACELVAAVRAVRISGIDVPDDGWGAAMAICDGLPADLADRDLTGDVDLAQTLLPALGDLAVQAAAPEIVAPT